MELPPDRLSKGYVFHLIVIQEVPMESNSPTAFSFIVLKKTDWLVLFVQILVFLRPALLGPSLPRQTFFFWQSKALSRVPVGCVVFTPVAYLQA